MGGGEEVNVGVRTYVGARTALELGFDAPGEVWTAVFGEDGVGADCVEIFGVD
jgi:hypothetical protein